MPGRLRSQHLVGENGHKDRNEERAKRARDGGERSLRSGGSSDAAWSKVKLSDARRGEERPSPCRASGPRRKRMRCGKIRLS